MRITRTIGCLAVILVCSLTYSSARAAVEGEVWLYADIWTDADETFGEGVTIYGTGSAELADCCPGCPSVTVEDELLLDSATQMDYSSDTALCYVTTYTDYYYIPGSSPDGEFEGRARVLENCAVPEQTVKVQPFSARFSYSFYNNTIGMHEWVPIDCSGACQPTRRCTHTHTNNYLWLFGTFVKIGFIGICKPQSQFQTSTLPACVQPPGTPIFADNCPSGEPVSSVESASRNSRH